MMAATRVDGDVGPAFDGSGEQEPDLRILRNDRGGNNEAGYSVVDDGLLGDDNRSAGLVHGYVFGVDEECAALCDVGRRRRDRLSSTLSDGHGICVDVTGAALADVDHLGADFLLKRLGGNLILRHGPILLSLGRILSESKALCLGGTRRAAERPMALGVASGILAAT